MKFNNFFKDPIYGEISFEHENLFLELIYTKEFLRLKNIKQLGVCEFIFHTATHNRFSHSIGVYHLAKIFMRHLKIDLDSYEAKVVLIASLLHDIGHGPFSHVFEKISHINHEVMTRKIIESEKTEINRILKKYKINPKDVSNIYFYKAKKPWMWQIVTSVIDVDRMDYILRDSYMIGTRYGTIDIPLLISRTKLNKKNYIIHSDRNKNIIQAFLQARVFMREDVYENNNVLIYEWILSNIFIELKLNIKKLLNSKKQILHWDLFSFLVLEHKISINEKVIQKYLELNDYLLLNFIKSIRKVNINENLNILIDSFFDGDNLEWEDIDDKKANFDNLKNKYDTTYSKLNYNLISLEKESSEKERFKNDILFYNSKKESSCDVWFSTLLTKKNDNIKLIKLINNNFIKR